MIRRFNPGGKAYRILARLERGPAPIEDLWQDANVAQRPNLRRKLFYVVISLKECGLLRLAREMPGDQYAVTAAGSEALATMRTGWVVNFEPVTPHIRHFNRDAA